MSPQDSADVFVRGRGFVTEFVADSEVVPNPRHLPAQFTFALGFLLRYTRRYRHWGILALGALINIACTLWVLGLAFRYQTVDVGSSMQTPVFVLLFLAPVYVPLALLTGWLHTAASINPITLILDAARGFISGEPDQVLYAFAASLVIAGLGWLWAMRQMKRAERGAA